MLMPNALITDYDVETLSVVHLAEGEISSTDKLQIFPTSTKQKHKVVMMYLL